MKLLIVGIILAIIILLIKYPSIFKFIMKIIANAIEIIAELADDIDTND